MSAIVGHLATAKGHVSTGKGVLQKIGSLGKDALKRIDKLDDDHFRIWPQDSLGTSSTSEIKRKTIYDINSESKLGKLNPNNWDYAGHIQTLENHGETIDAKRKVQLSGDESLERWNERYDKLEAEHFNEGEKSRKGKISEHLANNTKGRIIGVDGKHEGSVWGRDFGSENNRLSVDALGYEVEGEASLNIGKDGLNLNASGHAEVYLAKAEYEGRNGPFVGKAKAYIGAEANGALDVNFNPLNGDVNAEARVDAFAGGRAETELGVDGQYGKAGVNGGVSYGIGFEAGADVGIKDGKVAVDLDLGATVGLGGNIGFEGEIDVKETTKTVANGAKDVAGGAVNGVKDAAGGVKSLTGKIPGTPWG